MQDISVLRKNNNNDLSLNADPLVLFFKKLSQLR